MVVFFKKGRFYELYENDADIVSKEFGLRVTNRVNMRMSGVPEMSYGQWAGKLMNLGYKIARVDQVAEEGQSSNIIERRVSDVFTKSTVTDFTVDNGLEKPRLLALSRWTENDKVFNCFVIYESFSNAIIYDNAKFKLAELKDLFQMCAEHAPTELIFLEVQCLVYIIHRKTFRPTKKYTTFVLS